MADKLHTLTSNIIKFSAGEKPSADKFNAANEYFARSLRDISKAIGDIRDQGYPHVSDANKYTHLTGAWNPYELKPEGRPLDIVNLARLIGPASNLNPKMLKFDKLVAESISGLVMEYTLAYPYSDGSFSAGGGAVLTRVETDYFTGTNQFRVSNGIIYFSNTTLGGVNRSLIYETSSEGIFGGPNYEGASFNVIPDPNQPSKLSVVALANEVNAYSIDLGNCTHQQSGIKSKDSLLLSSLNAGEFNNGVELRLPGWMWEGDSPRFENGDSIPEGFLVVKNLTTNEVYQNANYYFISPTEIHIKGVSLCVDHEFCVITVGTDITTSIDDLRNKLHLHKHDGSFGEGRVSVKSLIDKFSEYSSVVYGESSIPNNHFPMYLHRSGFSLESNLNNGNNAMLGALLMGAASFNSLNSTVNTVIKNSPTLETTEGYQSQPILFTSADCAIYREDSADLKITNSNYKAINVEAGTVNIEANEINLINEQNNNLSSTNLSGTFLTQNFSNNIISSSTNNIINVSNQSNIKITRDGNLGLGQQANKHFMAAIVNNNRNDLENLNLGEGGFFVNEFSGILKHKHTNVINAETIFVSSENNVFSEYKADVEIYADGGKDFYVGGDVNDDQVTKQLREDLIITYPQVKETNIYSKFLLTHEIAEHGLDDFDGAKLESGSYSKTDFINILNTANINWVPDTLSEDPSNNDIYIDCTSNALLIKLYDETNSQYLDYMTDYEYENNSHIISLDIPNQNFTFRTNRKFDTGIVFSDGGKLYSVIKDVNVKINLVDSGVIFSRDKKMLFQGNENEEMNDANYEIDFPRGKSKYLRKTVYQEYEIGTAILQEARRGQYQEEPILVSMTQFLAPTATFIREYVSVEIKDIMGGYNEVKVTYFDIVSLLSDQSYYNGIPI